MLTSRLDKYPEFAYSPQVCNIGLANEVSIPCLWKPTAIGLTKEYLSVGMQGLRGTRGMGDCLVSVAVFSGILFSAWWLGKRYPAAF